MTVARLYEGRANGKYDIFIYQELSNSNEKPQTISHHLSYFFCIMLLLNIFLSVENKLYKTNTVESR